MLPPNHGILKHTSKFCPVFKDHLNDLLYFLSRIIFQEFLHVFTNISPVYVKRTIVTVDFEIHWPFKSRQSLWGLCGMKRGPTSVGDQIITKQGSYPLGHGGPKSLTCCMISVVFIYVIFFQWHYIIKVNGNFSKMHFSEKFWFCNTCLYRVKQPVALTDEIYSMIYLFISEIPVG